MKTNIPIFRAKTIKQDYNEWEECQQLKKIAGIWYAIGFYDCKRVVKTYLGDWETTHLILIRKSTATSEVNTSEVIDISTLSIHFPNILDSQGSKIFASLQEDGKGGDILLEESRLMCNLKIDESAFREFTAIHTINGVRFTNEKILSDIGSYRDKYFKGYDIMVYDFFMMKKRNIKIIGIQQ